MSKHKKKFNKMSEKKIKDQLLFENLCMLDPFHPDLELD